MNKDIFLRDLRRFLADLPEEEREQALTYYEDYFEDAGPENEQNVIQELGSPIEVAKQVKATNQENIAYGQGNDFQKGVYPNIYEGSEQAQGNAQNNYNGSSYTQNSGGYNSNNSYTQNSGGYNSNNSYTQNSGGYNGNHYTGTSGNYNSNHYAGASGNNGNPYYAQNQKKSWTQDPAKVTLVVILAILAIPVGIPLLSFIFGILIALVAVIFSLIIALFAIGGSLTIAGISSIIISFFTIGSVANVLTMVGVGLILTSIGIFIFWFGILFCSKFFPALIQGIGKLCQSIVRGIRSLFN